MWGPNTQPAVKNFQQSKGLQATGRSTKKPRTRLEWRTPPTVGNVQSSQCSIEPNQIV
ncbi:MAG TPA: peptidoglycan-binding protein [Candidatus Binatia bacterium]|nr:peptidoglycan-binding protein [Candidatus Binatia bacterium]